MNISKFWFNCSLLFIAICMYSCSIKEPSPSPINSSIFLRPGDLVLQANGNMYITNPCYLAKVTPAGVITSIAGTNGKSSCAGDGGLATAALLSNPSGICADSVGNIYFADIRCNIVHKINVSTGVITAIAGNGIEGFSGDGGIASSAELDGPSGVAFDKGGNLYIADGNNNRIREVNFKTGLITTIAGSGPSGNTGGYSGDGGAATSALLNNPFSIAFDDSMNLYICDGGNYRIRKVNASSGIINTIGGNGQNSFNGDSIPALSAGVNPQFIVLDTARNIYLTDYSNNRIREINNKTGVITTIAGNGKMGYSGDGGLAIYAELHGPIGITLDNSGNLYFADSQNGEIRKIALSTGIITVVVHN